MIWFSFLGDLGVFVVPFFRALTGKNNPVRLVQLRDVFTCPYNLHWIVSF